MLLVFHLAKHSSNFDFLLSLIVTISFFNVLGTVYMKMFKPASGSNLDI